MVRPSSRGGVPVFRRPSAKPSWSSVRDRPMAGASPTRPAGICFSPIWMRPRRNVPVVSTTAPAEISRPSASVTPQTRPSAMTQIVGFGLDDVQVGGRADRGLHGCRVELAVGLRARSAHRRALAAVETRGIGCRRASATRPIRPSKASISRTRWPLPRPPMAGLQRHGADGGEAMRHQRRARAHAGGRRRGLTAGMAAADHDDVELRSHVCLGCGVVAEARERGQKHRRFRRMFHVKHRRKVRRYRAYGCADTSRSLASHGRQIELRGAAIWPLREPAGRADASRRQNRSCRSRWRSPGRKSAIQPIAFGSCSACFQSGFLGHAALPATA